MRSSANYMVPETLESAIQGCKVVLLSPRSRTQNAMLRAFMNCRDVYLYALTAQDADLPRFLRGLVKSMGQDNPGFGAQTTRALDTRKAKIADIADALVADLDALKPRGRVLILDSFDYLTISEDVMRFLEKLVHALQDDAQLVVNARQLSFQPWQRLVQSGDAVVLGEEQALDGGILSSVADPTRAHLEIYAFGLGRVFSNGREIHEWEGPLPRNLFFYLIDHPLVTRDEIFATFWPNASQREATNVFHVTKRKITECVGIDLMDYSYGFYKPSKDLIIHYDVANFEEEIAEAIGQESQSFENWLRAIHLYRNAFLMASSMPWITERREMLRLRYTEALIAVGRIYAAQRKSEMAIHCYLRALNEVPDREDIHRDLMRTFDEQGEREKALAQYKMLRSHLRRAYGINPSEATQQLYSALSGDSE